MELNDFIYNDDLPPWHVNPFYVCAMGGSSVYSNPKPFVLHKTTRDPKGLPQLSSMSRQASICSTVAAMHAKVLAREDSLSVAGNCTA